MASRDMWANWRHKVSSQCSRMAEHSVGKRVSKDMRRTACITSTLKFKFPRFKAGFTSKHNRNTPTISRWFKCAQEDKYIVNGTRVRF
jgi:hypothetical protein